MNYAPTNAAQYSVILALAFAVSAAVLGQRITGTIIGDVYDPAQARVASADVLLKNLDSGISRSVTTSTDGSFEIPDPPTGRYSLQVSAKGFRELTKTNIILEVNQIRRVDAALELGELAQTVTVSASQGE